MMRGHGTQSRLERAGAFYYLLASCGILDHCFNETTELAGPFNSPVERDQALAQDLEDRVPRRKIVTLLKIEEGKLVRERSFLTDTTD